MAAQPRVRGERSGSVELALLIAGSAPRARGTGHGVDGRRQHRRLSPTCAGNGCAGHRGAAAATAQPRVRGERRSASACAINHAGSAPRARGTGPAWRRRPRRSAAQPRVRGERGIRGVRAPAPHGSAPRARGTAWGHGQTPSRRRLSPACAGNGQSVPDRTGVWAAQPRVRGERRVITRISFERTGSAPRARGTALQRHTPPQRRRLSPACAGNGLGRVRAARAAAGSAPRARGTVDPRMAAPTALAAQPRVRGERRRLRGRLVLRRGSAPRARGTDNRHPRSARRWRLSPACAGNGR